jgi:hypothetical protein
MKVIANQNPRNLRDKYKDWIGKKVTVGLTTFHYLSGTWKSIEGWYAIFSIGGRDQKVLMDEIDNVAESPSAQAEYYK